MELSDQDRTLLRLIQRDTSLSLADLAEVAGMGSSTVWRRIDAFEKAGLIRRRVAVLDPRRAGFGFCVFATVRLADHGAESVAEFARIVRDHPEIMEAHALTGTADYMLKIRAADVEAYDAFLSHYLLRSPVVRSVATSVSLRELKDTTELPL